MEGTQTFLIIYLAKPLGKIKELFKSRHLILILSTFLKHFGNIPFPIFEQIKIYIFQYQFEKVWKPSPEIIKKTVSFIKKRYISAKYAFLLIHSIFI